MMVCMAPCAALFARKGVAQCCACTLACPMRGTFREQCAASFLGLFIPKGACTVLRTVYSMLREIIR